MTGVTKELISKYSGAIPRYTSYPTAVEFSSPFSLKNWKECLANDSSFSRDNRNALSLYFHIPFCHSLCYFCACTKEIPKSKAVVKPFLSALSKELTLYNELISDEVPIQQIHWGGGSPNFLSPDEIRALAKIIRDSFPNILDDAEISVEADPRTTTMQQLSAWRESGFNRISFGVQDFSTDVQSVINREQSFEETKELADHARSLGFSGLNLDLVYGLPNQTLQSFQDSLRLALAIQPDRIAIYGYAHVTWIKKAQKALERAVIPQPELRIELLALAIKHITESGYRYLGMDHFALPEDSLCHALEDGSLARNFMGYTAHKGISTIGFGPSSISGNGFGFAQNVKTVGDYQERLSNNQLPIEKGLIKSNDDMIRGDVIESILTERKIIFDSFKARWSVDFGQYFASEFSELQKLETDGLIVLSSDRLQVTDLGVFFLRNIAMPFDAYLAKYKMKLGSVFSQAV